MTLANTSVTWPDQCALELAFRALYLFPPIQRILEHMAHFRHLSRLGAITSSSSISNQATPNSFQRPFIVRVPSTALAGAVKDQKF